MSVTGLVDIRSAHGHGPDLEQDVAVANLGNRYLAQLDGERLERVVDDGWLCSDWYTCGTATFGRVVATALL